MADSIEKSEYKFLQRLKGDFLADFRAESQWRDEREEYGRFYDGDQLSDEEKRELKERGQPAVVINRIKPKLDAIFGIQEGLQVDTKVYPAAPPLDVPVDPEQQFTPEQQAMLISEELRRIEDDSQFDEEESLLFEDICIDGRGWYKIAKEFDGLDGIDKITHVSNEAIVIDRFTSREDLRTGDLRTSKRVHETVWMDLEDAQELFPDYKSEIEASVNRPEMQSPFLLSNKLEEEKPDQYAQPGGTKGLSDADLEELSTFIDKKRKRVRVTTTYYRTPVVKKFLKHAGGTAEVTGESDKSIKKMLNEFDGATHWNEVRYALNSATFIWNCILEEKKDIRPYDKFGKFPLIMVPAYVTRDKTKRPYGLIKQQLDPQKEVNKRRSKMLHLLNVNQVWYEEGAFDDEPRAFREMARPDGKIRYRKEFKVDNIRHQDLAVSQFQLLQESKQEIDQSGVNPEIEGQSKATSGRDFQLRQQQAMQSIRKLFVNLRAARKRVAEYLLDEILYRKPYLTVRKYDLVIDEAPDTLSLMTETFDGLVSLARSGIQIPPDMIIEASPLDPAKKEQILVRLQQQQEAQMQMAMAQMQAQQVQPVAG